MNLLKRLIILFSTIIFILISTSFGFSVCKTTVDYIQVYSGNSNLGKFSDASSIYIKSDLNNEPIKIEMFIENDKASCYNQNDFKFKLFTTGAEAIANSVVTNPTGSGTFVTKAVFNFNVAIVVSSSFLSTYTISEIGGNFNSGSLQFLPDNSAPIFSQFSFPNTKIIKSGDEYKIDYFVSDNGAGLELISITGGISKIINFNSNNKSYSGSFIEYPTTSKNYLFKAEDKLGFSTTKSVNITVDGNPPIFSNLRTVYTYDGIRKVSFIVDVEDESFGVDNNFIPLVKADFSQINPYSSDVSGLCIKINPTKFECNFNDIPIALGDTSTVQIRMNTNDVVANFGEKVFSQEVFVDKDPATIIDFYLENSLGVKNNLGVIDKNSKVVLKFTDSSINDGPINVVEDFGLISFPIKNCILNNSIGTCTWELGDSVNVFKNYLEKTAKFKVAIYDMFGNVKVNSIDVIIDNKIPKIISTEFIETESIKDKIIKSKERINFRIRVSDENLFSGKYFIWGDFSQIDFRSGTNKVNGICNTYNSSTVQCDFNNIIVENGYLNREISFHISDISGNNITQKMKVEIFKVSNEVVSSYKISNIFTTNPLPRDMMKSRGGTAWFEGSLKSNDNQMVIVNYQLQGCDEQNLDPIIITNFGMYPDDSIINNGQQNVEDFAIYFDLKGHENIYDLNDKNMKCTMSVLKRDATQVYPPELVDFTISFSFFDVPGGNLLKRNAQNILNMANEVAWSEGWFDSLYTMYHTLSKLCNVVTKGGGIINGVVEIWNLIQPQPEVLTCDKTFLGLCTGEFKLTSENAKGKILTSLTKNGFVKKACDWVTCRNGGWIGAAVSTFGSDGASFGLEDIPLVNNLIDVQNKIGEFACTIGVDKK